MLQAQADDGAHDQDVAIGPDRDGGVDARPPSRNDRAALWVFAGYLAVALPLLVWMGSYRWFLGDEWWFLTDRSVSVHDLLRDHNQHWSTTPVLVYRGLYSLVGLHAYWPYQLVVIVLHLTAAALLRVVMRRAGVGPWIATVAAGAFVLLGPAEDNILWSFQIGFVGALVLGITQMLLADHDGPIDRRDWYGLGVGLVCLVTSGQAIGLIAATGVVCLFRRRWWAGAFHTLPLAAVYAAWFVGTNVEPVLSVDDRTFTVGEYLGWMKDAVVGVITGLGHFQLIAIALAVMLVAGLVVAVYFEGANLFLRRAAIPIALLFAAVVSMSAAAPSRFALGVGQASSGRYIGVMAALTLPALAVAADALAKRWRWTAPLVVAAFVVPIPFNIVAFGDDPVLTRASFQGVRTYVATLPDNPLTRQVPLWVRPNEGLLGQPGMTVGWLLNADREGELPEPTAPMNPLVAQLLRLQLGVATVDEATADGLNCADYTAPLAVDPGVGDRWYFETPVQVAGRSGDKPSTLGRKFLESGVEITLPDLELLVMPATDATSFRLCR